MGAPDTRPQATETGRRTPAWRLLHFGIIIALVLQCMYCGYQVFVSLAPEGQIGMPLGRSAAHLPVQLVLARRLYAIEGWLCGIGLAIYLSITERGMRRPRG